MLSLFKRHGAAPGFAPGQISITGVYVPTSAEVKAFQAARVPWAKQVVYGYYTLALLCGLLVLAIGANMLWKARVRWNAGTRVGGRALALARMLSYPRARPSAADWVWTPPPLGYGLVILATLLVTTCLTFANKYQYYPPFYGSAPLYLRAEWCAMALLPFVYILAAKRNPITTLTGIPHDKLQALHQGAALIFVYLSLVHTVAACVRANRQMGMVRTLATNEVYLSGFVALAPLCVLLVGALPPFRKFAYETFYAIHIPMAIFFLGALFWHGYQLLDSDAYCIATIILAGSAAAWRGGMMLLDNPHAHRAQLTPLDDETFSISIPTALEWRPGQHVFLRFLCRPLESHPFTIANAPHGARAGSGQSGLPREMRFLVRAKTGLTSLLAAKGATSLAALVDGPYGADGGELAAFDRTLLFAGGSGISWAVAVAQALRGGVLVWAVRHEGWLAWFGGEIAALRANGFEVRVYVTGTAAETPEGDTPDKELVIPKHCAGRPDVAGIIAEFIAAGSGSVGIGACGPAGLIADAANAAARAQADIVAGRSGVREVFLATEAYSW